MFIQKKTKIKIRKIKPSKIIYIVGYFCRDVATSTNLNCSDASKKIPHYINNFLMN